MTHVGERRTVSLDRPNVWLTHLNLAVAQRICFALLWELSNYRIGFGARFAFCCDFSRVELGFKVLQFVFGDVLPRVCGQLLASTVHPAIRVRLCLARLTLCLIRAWSSQASAPNLPASVGPRAKPGARRLPKLSLLKGFWSCYRAESSARGGGLRISPSS